MAWTHHRWLMLHSARHAHRLDAGSRLRRYQTLPEISGCCGIKPVIIAIVAQALWQLGLKAAKDIPTIVAGVGDCCLFPECG